LRDSAIAYWLIDGSPAGDDQNERRNAIGRNEAITMALQHQIASLRSSLADDLGRDQIPILAQVEASLFDAATGGTFGVANRDADFGRGRMVSSAAASYINAVREARNTHLTRRSLLFFWP
jgi:hypothetical protein